MNSGLLPIPTNPCGQQEFGIKPTTNEDLAIAKVDYQISDKHSLFGRYEIAHLVDPSGFSSSNLLSTGTASDGPYTTYPVVNAWQTQSFCHWGYLPNQRQHGQFLPRGIAQADEPKGTATGEKLDPSAGRNFGNYGSHDEQNSGAPAYREGSALADKAGTFLWTTNAIAYQVSEDISWVKGAHQFGFR